MTLEIAEARGVQPWVDCVSPASHGAFKTPIEMMHFIERLRELSGGKPTGFKLCIGHPWEWFGIAKAMQETGILPDFIVVDGAEGGTGAAPLEFTDHVGAPLQEGLLLVHNTLVGLDLRDRIKLGCAGKVVSAFDIARMLALGADWCNAARGFMFALGCIQAQTCHTGNCPTGVTTQDAQRQKALDPLEQGRPRLPLPPEHADGAEGAGAGGRPRATRPRSPPTHIVRRNSEHGVKLLANLLPFVQAGRLLGAASCRCRSSGPTGRWPARRASPPPIAEQRGAASHGGARTRARRRARPDQARAAPCR